MTRREIILRLAGSFDNPGTRTSPRGDHDLNPEIRPEGELTQAAVLVPLVDRPEGIMVLFTRRTEHLANHAGQISFPGGHMEPADETLNDTALRETEEEVGIERTAIEIIGRLDQYLTRTGFSVTPVVGVVNPGYKSKPDPREVAEVFEVPLSFLMDPANHHRHSRVFKGARREYHAMPYGDYYIWGATAGMVKNLYDVLAGDT